MEPWIQTYTGKKFWPLAPKKEDVCIEDIAHALSMKCRFGGHCKEFYSVADHSLRVMSLVKPEYQLTALLHDAAEAYLPDLLAPVKSEFFIKRDSTSEQDHVSAYGGDWGGFTLQEFSRSELRSFALHESCVLREIFDCFGVARIMPQAVKQADLILLATEARDLMGKPPEPWDLDVPLLPERIIPLTPDTAKLEFLAAFKRLMGSIEGAQK